VKRSLGLGSFYDAEDNGGDGTPLATQRCRRHEISSRSAACTVAVLANNQVDDELMVVLLVALAFPSPPSVTNNRNYSRYPGSVTTTTTTSIRFCFMQLMTND
jgi:hypothetical protein